PPGRFPSGDRRGAASGPASPKPHGRHPQPTQHAAGQAGGGERQAEARDGVHRAAQQALAREPRRLALLDTVRAVHFVRPSADLLFESVAGSFKNRAIAVVLTGTGSDGSMGVQAIKKMGGTVLAQDESSSEFYGMPNAAIQTGCVDFILSLSEIPAALLTLLKAGGGEEVGWRAVGGAPRLSQKATFHTIGRGVCWRRFPGEDPLALAGVDA